MPLPRHFCWTRFGTEAGETIDQILLRKEDERQANRGVFLWGIGNAIGPSMRELVRREASPQVVFSPIRSKPCREDIAPAQIVAWTAGRTLDGNYYDLPRGSFVTSRSSTDNKRQKHYALVCASAQPLRIRENAEAILISQLRNLLTDRRIGASQVTAVVRLDDNHFNSANVAYAAAIRAELVYPYFIELINPVPLLVSLRSSAESMPMVYSNSVDYMKWLEEHSTYHGFQSIKRQNVSSF